jgi:hypothetical protein
LEEVALDTKKLNDEKKERPMNKSPQLIGDQVSLIISVNNDQRSPHAKKGLHGSIIMRQLKSINLLIHFLISLYSHCVIL